MLTKDEIQEVKILKEVLIQKLNKEGGKKVLLYFHDLPKPLNEEMALENLLDLISEKSKRNIKWQKRFEQRRAAISVSNPEPQLSAPFVVGVEIYIREPNKLQSYFEQLVGNSLNEKIKSLEIYTDENFRKLIFINKNYNDDPLEPRAQGKYWKTLYEIADDGNAESSEAQAIADYFNTNKSNILYSKDKYQLTRILEVDGNEVLSKIPIKNITSKALTQRRNNSLKNT